MWTDVFGRRRGDEFNLKKAGSRGRMGATTMPNTKRDDDDTNDRRLDEELRRLCALKEAVIRISHEARSAGLDEAATLLGATEISLDDTIRRLIEEEAGRSGEFVEECDQGFASAYAPCRTH